MQRMLLSFGFVTHWIEKRNQRYIMWFLFAAALPLLTLLLTCSASYAQTAAVTQQEIDQAVAVSKVYPSYLQLRGNTVVTETPPVIIRGRVLIPARAFFEAMGGNVAWDDASRTVTVTTNGIVVVLTLDSGTALIGGVAASLDVPALIIDSDGDGQGSTMIPVRFVTQALGYTPIWDENTRIVNVVPGSDMAVDVKQEQPATPPATVPDNTQNNQNSGTTADGLPVLNSKLSGKVVVIDAGHGGTDPGSSGQAGGAKINEKDVNLDIALRLNNYLKSAGVSTYLMRDNDIAVVLRDRPARANAANGYLFVSIHNNSSELSAVSGTEVYYYAKDSEKGYPLGSKTLAQSVQKEMIMQLGTRDRGIKSEPEYAVLNKTQMPAILIEGAFLSNPDDLKLIQTDEYRQKYAFAAAKGILETMNAGIK